MNIEKVKDFVDAYQASEDSTAFYKAWEGEMQPVELDAAIVEYESRQKIPAERVHFRSFILGEHAMPIISTGPARKLTKQEKQWLKSKGRVDDTDEHAQD